MTIRAPAPAPTRARRRVGRWAMIAALGTGGAVAVSSPGTAADHAPIGQGMTIGPDAGPANPSPSTIEVSDVPGLIIAAPRVTLTDLTHTYFADLNIVLQAPSGKTVLLTADCRGNRAVDGTITFADGGDALHLIDGTLGTGTYAPLECGVPEFDDGAPQCPCGHSFARLIGDDPNGTWSLYVFDDGDADSGAFTAWTLEFTTNAAPVATDGSFAGPAEKSLRDSLTPLARDPDGDDLDFAVATEPAHGTVYVNSSGTFLYTPDDGFVGVDTFTYRVDDNRLSDDGAVTITVNDVPLPHATCAGRTATVVGTSGSDVLTGTRGPDVIAAGRGRDSIDGGGGNDVICGGAGNDTVRGGAGDDTLDGGADRDVLRGGAGDDSVAGNLGGDIVAGGTGNDTLLGRSGNDTLVGLSGADQLAGGQGIDHCFGGTGTDRAATCERLLAVP